VGPKNHCSPAPKAQDERSAEGKSESPEDFQLGKSSACMAVERKVDLHTELQVFKERTWGISEMAMSSDPDHHFVHGLEREREKKKKQYFSRMSCAP